MVWELVWELGGVKESHNFILPKTQNPEAKILDMFFYTFRDLFVVSPSGFLEGDGTNGRPGSVPLGGSRCLMAGRL